MVAWLIGQQLAERPGHANGSVEIFILGYLVLIALVAIWARWLSRQVYGGKFRDRYRGFSRVARLSRWFIPLWMGVDVLLGASWARWVLRHTGTYLQFPAIFIGIIPAMLTWMALWWAEYPAERAMREQNVLDDLMHDLPVHE